MVKSILSILIISSIGLGACGKCGSDGAKDDKAHKSHATVNALVMEVPKDGQLEGIVITSCGTCNLGVKGKGCSLSVKIGEKTYPVEGTTIHDHGDAHGKEGFCSVIRVARAKGEIKKDVFHAESFVLVGD